jgi:hypothetical protein
MASGQPRVHLTDDVAQVGAAKAGSRKRSCSRDAPADERRGIRLLPEAGHERAHEQGLDAAPSGGAAASRSRAVSSSPSRPRSESGAEELVDAELRAVSVADEVGQQVPQSRSTSHGDVTASPDPLGPGSGLGRGALHLGEGDLQLVERLETPLVDPRRLARRPDESAREDIGQRGVVLPIGDDAAQADRAAQQRGVGGPRPAEREVVAAAGAGVGAVEVELLGREMDLTGVLVER